jgi:hypothetical protein
MQFRKLSGCYECHMIVDPSRYTALAFIFLLISHFLFDNKKEKKRT